MPVVRGLADAGAVVAVIAVLCTVARRLGVAVIVTAGMRCCAGGAGACRSYGAAVSGTVRVVAVIALTSTVTSVAAIVDCMVSAAELQAVGTLGVIVCVAVLAVV